MQARIRRDLANARWLMDAGGRRAAAGSGSRPCRSRPCACGTSLPASPRTRTLAAHNLAIARRVNGGGRAYVTPSVLKGRQMIRVSIGATATERADVEKVWGELREAAG